MNIKSIINIIICNILLLFIFNISGFSQDKKAQLQNNKKKLEQEIALTNKMLSETRKNRETSIHQLNLITFQVKKREELIRAMNNEVAEIDKEINNYTTEINQYEENIEQLKAALAKMIYNIYKTRNSHARLMFIFSATDFNQALLRLQYLKLYGQHIQSNAEQIKLTQKKLKEAIDNLKKVKEEKSVLISQQQNEKDKLTKSTKEKNETIATLRKKENELRKSIKEKEKAAKNLQNAINKIIQDEIAAAAKKTGTKPVKNTMPLAPEEVALSNEFGNNKGKLPWPVEKGFISSTFGSHPHPVLPGIVVKNDGVNFSSLKGAAARAVFNGKVTAVTSIPSYNNVVMIRHGEYLSVYANLATVNVKTGDNVKTKQVIGTLFYDNEDKNAILHFELRKGTGLLNPSDWLVK